MEKIHFLLALGLSVYGGRFRSEALSHPGLFYVIDIRNSVRTVIVSGCTPLFAVVCVVTCALASLIWRLIRDTHSTHPSQCGVSTTHFFTPFMSTWLWCFLSEVIRASELKCNDIIKNSRTDKELEAKHYNFAQCTACREVRISCAAQLE